LKKFIKLILYDISNKSETAGINKEILKTSKTEAKTIKKITKGNFFLSLGLKSENDFLAKFII
jgi:hypothetical protein